MIQLSDFIDAFGQIGLAFVTDLGVWWFLTPIFILWIVMEVYLGEYKKEKWGFSSSLANSISFTWINIVALRLIFLESDPTSEVRLWVAVLFLLFGLFLIYMSFRHIFSEHIMETIAGPTPVYFLSVISALWGQGLLSISAAIVVDLALIYIIIFWTWKLIKERYLGIRGEIEAIKKGENPI